MAAIWAGLGILGALLAVAFGDLVSEEIRGWLDLVPQGILRLAAAQLDQAQQETIYEDEWLPELQYALRGAESRPITRLIQGTRYAFGLLIAARRVSRHIDREHLTAPVSRELASSWNIFEFELPEYAFMNATGNPVTISSIYDTAIIINNGNAYVGPVLGKDIERLEDLGIMVDWRQ